MEPGLSQQVASGARSLAVWLSVGLAADLVRRIGELFARCKSTRMWLATRQAPPGDERLRHCGARKRQHPRRQQQVASRRVGSGRESGPGEEEWRGRASLGSLVVGGAAGVLIAQFRRSRAAYLESVEAICEQAGRAPSSSEERPRLLFPLSRRPTRLLVFISAATTTTTSTGLVKVVAAHNNGLRSKHTTGASGRLWDRSSESLWRYSESRKLQVSAAGCSPRIRIGLGTCARSEMAKQISDPSAAHWPASPVRSAYLSR